MAEMVKCRYCTKSIRLVPTAKGRLMPVDPDPAGRSAGLERTGNGVVVPNLAILNGQVHVLRPDEPYDGDLYVSHFATCPYARRSDRKIPKRAYDRTHARVWEGLDEERQGENDGHSDH